MKDYHAAFDDANCYWVVRLRTEGVLHKSDERTRCFWSSLWNPRSRTIRTQVSMRLVLAILLGTLLAGCGGSTESEELNAQIDGLRDQVFELQQKVHAAQVECDELRSENDTLRKAFKSEKQAWLRIWAIHKEIATNNIYLESEMRMYKSMLEIDSPNRAAAYLAKATLWREKNDRLHEEVVAWIAKFGEPPN